jgi:hypothetical protein
MLRPAATVEILRAWLRLTPHGRRFLREFRPVAARALRSDRTGALKDPARRRSLLRSLRAADRAFGAHVPEALCRRLGRAPYQVYRRLVSFAWLNGEVRCRILDAFALPYDEAAIERVALLNFLSREWNDLQDRFPTPRLVRIFRGDDQDPPEACLLAVHLAQECRRRMPVEQFPRFHAHLREVPRLSERPFAPEIARERLANKGHAATLGALYAAIPDVPDQVGDALKPLSLWLYELDDYADRLRDLARGHQTLMTTVEAPEAELLRSLREAEAAVRSVAGRPERLLSAMDSLTRMVLDNDPRDLDVERDVFFLPSSPS